MNHTARLKEVGIRLKGQRMRSEAGTDLGRYSHWKAEFLILRGKEKLKTNKYEKQTNEKKVN